MYLYGEKKKYIQCFEWSRDGEVVNCSGTFEILCMEGLES